MAIISNELSVCKTDAFKRILYDTFINLAYLNYFDVYSRNLLTSIRYSDIATSSPGSLCWSYVDSIEAGNFSRIDYNNRCGRTQNSEVPTYINCMKAMFPSYAYQLYESIPSQFTCESKSISTFIAQHMSSLIEKAGKTLVDAIIAGIYDSVYVCSTDTNLSGTVSYEAWSATGSLLDVSTNGVTANTMVYLSDLFISQGLAPSNITVYLDRINFNTLAESNKTLYGTGCCVLYDASRSNGRNNIYIDYSTGMKIVVLPQSYFKVDTSGNPILFAIADDGLSFYVDVLEDKFFDMDGVHKQSDRTVLEFANGFRMGVYKSVGNLSFEPGLQLKTNFVVSSLKPRREFIEFIKGKKGTITVSDIPDITKSENIAIELPNNGGNYIVHDEPELLVKKQKDTDNGSIKLHNHKTDKDI